jgi:chromosome segregation protein
LLKLRKVELVGFKSFCERTIITISGEGMTCIVGPNGCGKSNVVDAISWVLGEQSHKSLRAERMADCIFNGTAKRPPMGLAEVTITLEDPDLAEAARFVLDGLPTSQDPDKLADSAESPAPLGDAASSDAATADATSIQTAEPADPSVEEDTSKPRRRKRAADKPEIQTKPGEVVVGRRLYRSGQSEYLLNGRVARLRDIQDLFMGMGLGPDSYAIIEQGRIGLILASKPLERRAIIEEAAGVTKYKTKRRLAEAKLESSKVNLARVNDIVVEVEKQLGSLKRQASKARRFAEIREQMRGIIRQVLASKAHELDSEADRLAVKLREVTEAESTHARTLEQAEVQQERLNQRIYELDAELRQNQNLLNLTALELDRAENRIGFNRQRTQELDARCAQLTAQIAQVQQQHTEIGARCEAHEGTLAALREQAASLNVLVEELSAQSLSRAEQAQHAEARIEELRRQAAEAGERLMHLHGEHRQAEEALAHQSELQKKLEAAEHQLLEEAVRLRDQSEATAREWQTAVDRARQLESEIAEIQARLAGLRRRKEETAAEAEAIRDSLAAVRARRGTLQQILNDRAYTAEAVQKLFAAKESGSSRNFRAVGILADYAEVAEQHEAAVEQFLRDELEYVVVETYDLARAGIALLRDKVGGRATFFVDSLGTLRLNEFEPVIHFRREDGVISRLDKLVEFRDPLGAAAKQFLPRLRSAFLIDSAAAAEKLARENPQYAFVLPDGTCYQGRMVTGGRRDEAGPLGMKRELRALETEFLGLERRSSAILSAIEQIESDLHAAEESLERTTAEHRDAERAVFGASNRREQCQSELARLGVELYSCQADLARVRREVESAAERASLAQKEHAGTAEARAAAEAEAVRLAQVLVALRQSVQSAQEELAARRAEQAALAERVASTEAVAQRFADELREAESREATLQEQLAALSAEHSATETQTIELARQLDSRRAEKSRLETLQTKLESEWDAARNRIAELDDALRLGRQSLDELREERNRMEIDRARNDSDRQHLRDTCLAELNAHPEDLIAQEPVLLTGDELAAAEANYRDMRARIEAMGPVNMMALEEFNECEQRFSFLTRERDDLLQSIADTQQAITELDQVSRERFEAAFAAINQNFAESFRVLFGGGTGEMRLTEPDSSGEAGIDVIAQPPGKRLQNVLLLSGGEKAMTALALLIAIFRYQPSPFCILDEVDAPLDEANVGRFTRMLAEMSAQTQFIVVTHNRRTMEMASVLYGVTMQEPGVSRLVSVRWDDQRPAAPKQAAASAA